MSSKVSNQHPIAHLRTACHTLFSNPAILFPFSIVAFIQILVLEVIFFAPRYPLSLFFEPMITRLEGSVYLHYPYTFFVLTKWFQHTQIPLYIFFNSLAIGTAVIMIDLINKEKRLTFRTVFGQTISVYIHLIIAASISVAFMYSFSSLYGLLVKRAEIIRSTSGIYFIIKQIVIQGAPYFNLLIAVLSISMFAFVIPFIVIERKNIFSAILLNFKTLWRSFWFMFIVLFLPALLFIPVLLLKTNRYLFDNIFPPEAWGLLIIVSIIVTLFIDAMQYTAITMYYLLKKEI